MSAARWDRQLGRKATHKMGKKKKNQNLVRWATTPGGTGTHAVLWASKFCNLDLRKSETREPKGGSTCGGLEVFWSGSSLRGLMNTGAVVAETEASVFSGAWTAHQGKCG